MYQTNYMRRPVNAPTPYYNNNNNRFIGGGFAVPFLLGGLTGGLLAPAFNQRPYYNAPYPNYPYQPYPPYQQYPTYY